MDDINQLCAQLGEDKLRAMVSAFYTRVKADGLIGKMYPPEDWPGAEKRLADFIVYRFGGPQTYLQERGHPRLRARHFPFTIGIPERDRWLELMAEAMAEVQIPAPESAAMGQFFAQVADMMRNVEV